MDDFNFSKCHTANIIVGYWNRLIKTPKRLIKAYVQSPERDERLNNCHNWIKAYMKAYSFFFTFPAEYIRPADHWKDLEWTC